MRTSAVRRYVLVLLSATVAACQGNQQSASTELPAPAPLRFPVGQFEHGLKIESTYERFKNRTTIQIEHSKIFSSDSHRFWLSASTSFDGQQLVAIPDGVVLRLSGDWRGTRRIEPDCIFLADGERVLQGHNSTEPAESGAAAPELRAGWQTQNAYYAFDVRQFLRLIAATKIEGRCWGGEFPVDGEIVSALRDFATRLNPKAGE